MKIVKEMLPYVIVIFLALFTRIFWFTPVQVDGYSMYPTLKDGQILILKEYDHTYERFDIVIIKYNNDKLVKRIIGIPGDSLEYKNNVLYVNGKKIKEPIDVETNNFKLEDLGYQEIPKDYYLVLGDNRSNSTDSRIIGLINKKNILGTTNFRIWPLNVFGTIKSA